MLRAQIYYTSRTPSWTYDLRLHNLQRDARQDRLEVQEMFRAILDRLPPASGPSHHHQPRDVLVLVFLPLHYFIFSISAHCGQCDF
jgi:hypothetical protein